MEFHLSIIYVYICNGYIYICCEGAQTLKQVSHGGYGVFTPGDAQKLSGRGPQ